MSPPEPQGLRAENLSLAYGDTLVVDALDLTIGPGLFTVLLGPNGSGKSTLLRAFAGLLKPKAGHILLDGQPIHRFSARALAKRIGVLAQGPAAPEGLTVRDLVRQGRYPHRPLFGRWTATDEAACTKALALTGTTHLAERLLETLSGGQRQRAWIAMTLAQETDILLLDEPTTFLDLSHQIDVMDLVVELVRHHGKTVVAVLHDLNQAARHADHIVLMKAGKVVGEGTPAAVVTAQRVSEAFGVAVVVMPDPLAGTPMCVPVPAAGAAKM
jgi:iron complex transport system ATP-binding protein